MRLILTVVLMLAVSGVFCIPALLLGEETKSESKEEATVTNQTEDDEILAEQKYVQGKRERRLFRIKRLGALLKGDMLDTYETYGYPSSRYREEVMGRVVERWTYLEEGKQFTFRDGALIRERQFAPGSP
jgi:hypothetical protein